MKKITFLFCALIALQFNAQTSTVDGSGGNIPDNDPVGITFTADASNAGTITDMDIDLAITHTWNGDIFITLTSPTGTEVVFYDRPGVPASGAGCNDDGSDINLKDGHAGDLEVCEGTTTTGDYNPSNPLSAFFGEEAAGTWTILISDNAAGDSGSLDNWDVNMQVTGSASQSDNTIEGFNMYPNPANELLNISAINEIQQITIFNALGQKVILVTPNSLNDTISISSLNTGVYIVNVISNKESGSYTLVKK